MIKKDPKDPRKVLDETAISIQRLVRDLENREIGGDGVTATEIQTIASLLQAHVEELLAAANSLREVKPEPASDGFTAHDQQRMTPGARKGN
jgi:hypothetical protein